MSENPEKSENLPKKKEDPKEVVAEEFKDVPLEVQRFFQSSYIGPAPNPLLDKLTSDHVSEIIAESREDNKRRYDFATSGRWIKLIYFFIGVVVVSLLTIFLLPYDSEMYFRVIELLVVFGGGYGVGNALPMKRK